MPSICSVPKLSTAMSRLAIACGLALSAGACTHEGFGTQALHYATFSVPEPKDATVHVCHGYGCKFRTKFTFTQADIAALQALMTKTRGKAMDTPEEERRAIAYAIGWMETRTGNVIGTKGDRPGMDFMASGDPTQQDCVDEATNTTSYLIVLANNGLIRHHTVSMPFAKENYLRGVAGWTHWTAVIVEKPWTAPPLQVADKRKVKSKAPVEPAVAGYVTQPGQRWAVDSWIYANGENPAIVKAEEWYISDLDSLPKPKR